MIVGLQQALDLQGGSHTLEDMVAQVERGEAQLWTAQDAAIVTEIKDTPQLRELHFWLAAGELDAVVRLSRDALEWGREMGCTRATLIGRKGWVRALRDEGWTHEMVMMGREI